jgi:hypothetical protein
MECTAGDVHGGFLSFQLLARDMRVAGSGDWRGLRGVRQRQTQQGVRDECSHGYFAGDLGYGSG